MSTASPRARHDTHATPPPVPARRRAGTAVAVGTAAVVVLIALIVLLVQRGEALPGTSLGGVDVGGLGRADVTAVAERLAAERSAGVVRVVAGNRESTVAATDVDVTVDAARSAQRAVDAGRDGLLPSIWNGVASWFGQDRHVDPVTEMDHGALAAEVERIRSEVDREPRRGGFTISTAPVGTETGAARAEVRRPRTGQTLLVDEAADTLRSAFVTGADEVELAVDVTDPGVTLDQARAVTARANAVLAQPLVLTDDDGREVTLQPDDLAPLLAARRDPTTGLRLAVRRAEAVATVERTTASLESEPASAALASPRPEVLLTAKGDASFRPRKIGTSVSGGRDGLEVDVEATVDSLTEAVLAEQRTARMVTVVLPAPVSAAQLRKVDQVIGSFTTSYACCAPRARNIARIAEIVDGTVVPPGETFSLNQVAGERTKARGFFEDGAILHGELVQQVGGGVSQFSTTLFNAVWFAGLPSLEHQPHSAYISRYPPGREATLNWGSIDNVFRNDTDHPVVVRTATTPTSVTVALYGRVGKRVVESTTGPRQKRPGGGFRVVVDRTVHDRGRLVSQDRLTWSYGPPLA